MKLEKVAELLNAKVLSGSDQLQREVDHAFSSDLMSDVLTVDTANVLLLTGLANIQSLRTAEMADINQVAVVRNKQVTSEMIDLANENGIVLLSVEASLFRASGILYEAGLKPLY